MNLSCFENKKILITGATGLIGSSIIKRLLDYNKSSREKIDVVAFVRNKEKAQKVFAGYDTDNLSYEVGDICNPQIKATDVDYIIHGASKTASKAFVDEPVETVMTTLNGTIGMLEYARKNPVKSFVFLSTMEVYGSPATDEKIAEDHATNLDTMKVRSCYPEGKRLVENLCTSYASEYQVPAKVVRLTQTFGPGVEYNDGRVFAEFARCAIEGRNIVLNTKGETKRSYLYTEDAVDAILTVLENGQVGEAYNAANEETYCSIYEMACMVASKCANDNICVEIHESDNLNKFGYAPTLKMNLDTSKLKSLGWRAKTDLYSMFANMIEDMKK